VATAISAAGRGRGRRDPKGGTTDKPQERETRSTLTAAREDTPGSNSQSTHGRRPPSAEKLQRNESSTRRCRDTAQQADREETEIDLKAAATERLDSGPVHRVRARRATQAPYCDLRSGLAACQPRSLAHQAKRRLRSNLAILSQRAHTPGEALVALWARARGSPRAHTLACMITTQSAVERTFAIARLSHLHSVADPFARKITRRSGRKDEVTAPPARLPEHAQAKSGP